MTSCWNNRSRNQQPEKTYWEKMDEGWTSLGHVTTYDQDSYGTVHSCSDCARLDYRVVNGETRYRIFYPLHSTYYNVTRNPNYGSSAWYGAYEYKAGNIYLNL